MNGREEQGSGTPPAENRERRVDVVLPELVEARESNTATAAVLTAEEPEAAALLAADGAMWAIVLAGGIGSRFWPLSTPERPKQLLNLVGDHPLIAESVARLAPLVPPERVLVLTSRDIAEAIHAAIPSVPRENMLVEPRPLGTAAALAWGAHEVARRAGPETIFCCLHADLAVGFPELFRQLVSQCARVAANAPVLVAVGSKPTRPETGFGYLRVGGTAPRVSALGALSVEAFVEKPNLVMAETLIADGALWNTGIFVWRARVALDAIREHTSELADGFDALERGDHGEFARSIQSISIERGLLERSRDVVAMLGDFQWDDVGTWASLRRARELDDTGNGAIGRAHFVESTGNVVHAEQGTIVLYGCSGMLVVQIDGLTFVTPVEKAADLRPLLDTLPMEMRTNPSG